MDDIKETAFAKARSEFAGAKPLAATVTADGFTRALALDPSLKPGGSYLWEGAASIFATVAGKAVECRVKVTVTPKGSVPRFYARRSRGRFTPKESK